MDQTPSPLGSTYDAKEKKVNSLRSIYQSATFLFDHSEFSEARRALLDFTQHIADVSHVDATGESIINPRASIIVVSHKHDEKVELGLDELFIQTNNQNFEIIFVANGNDELSLAARARFQNCITITPPFPVGAATGRNLGALLAQADFIVYLDDDGIMAPGCLNALVRCAQETGAVAVRGRVRPLTSPDRTAEHYDLGERRCPSLITCEGVSIWERNEFLRVGGFDPLLYGHEGLELCARLWRFHGPTGFLYEPTAILMHDYSDSPEKLIAKQSRYERNQEYIRTLHPDIYEIHHRTKSTWATARSMFLSSLSISDLGKPTNGRTPVSIITTARNASAWIEDYVLSWKRQTSGNFQLIFVDDGSTDRTPEILKSHWGNDNRLKIIECQFRGRGASLNTAVFHAEHDLCLIADVDDVSHHMRIGRTIEVFERNKDLDYLSFLAYTERDHYRIGRPHSPFIYDMSVRTLFGMPGSFPTFAFRKSKFPLSFDEERRGGIDCDWFLRNIKADPNIIGQLVHLPMVYYRMHGNQITSFFKQAQIDIRKELIHYGFSRIIGSLSDMDRKYIDILVGSGKANGVERKAISDWLAILMMENRAKGIYDEVSLGLALTEAFDRVVVPDLPSAKSGSASNKSGSASNKSGSASNKSGSASNKSGAASNKSGADKNSSGPTTNEGGGGNVDRELHGLRMQAEKHIASGEFKQARRLLRRALGLRDEWHIRSRLLAANRFALLRVLARARPYSKI